jgi:hypothetical protein
MVEYEALAQGVAMFTGDHREGVRAFREKRRPRFGTTAGGDNGPA